VVRALVIPLALASALSLFVPAPASAAFSISGDRAVAEGSSLIGQAVSLTISDNEPPLERRCVTWATVAGSATAMYSGGASGDYYAATLVECFDPGVSSQTISIPIAGDTSFEPDESFSVRLSNAYFSSGLRPYAIADGVAVITLLNDDAQPPPPSSGGPPPAAPPPADEPEPQECTIAQMEERYANRGGFPRDGGNQFYGLMRAAAEELARGGINDIVRGRLKLSNVLACSTGTVAGRVHLLRKGRPPLLLAAGKRSYDYGDGAGRNGVRLRVKAAARSALRGKSRARARVTVKHADTQGSAARKRYRLTLTRDSSSGR
jgi:hypothetical protein